MIIFAIVLYLADRDGGTNPNDPSVAVIRKFDLKTGAVSTVYDACDGRALRGPNDIVFDDAGVMQLRRGHVHRDGDAGPAGLGQLEVVGAGLAQHPGIGFVACLSQGRPVAVGASAGRSVRRPGPPRPH